MTLGELIEKLGGTLIQGSTQLEIESVSSYEQAVPSSLVFADSAASVPEALATEAGAVVLAPGASASYPESLSVVEAKQPRLWFARAAKLLNPPPSGKGIHPTAVVAQTAILGEGVTVGPMAVIGEDVCIRARTNIRAGVVVGQAVDIGQDCQIYPRAVLYAGTQLGNRVVVHAGAVLGADGFGYVRDSTTGAYTQFPQQGTLVIEDDVEIGANSTIDRGALAETASAAA